MNKETGGGSGSSGYSRNRLVLLSWAGLTLAGLLYGYNWVVMKAGLAYADPAAFAALRVVLAAAFLFLVMIVLRRSLRPPSWGVPMLTGLFGTAAFTALTFWALKLGSAGKTSMLYYTMPIWLLILSRLLLGERVRGYQWLYVALALAGLVLVISPWSVGGTIVGNLLAVAAGVCAAVAAILVKTLFKNQRTDVLSLTAWQTLWGSVPLVIMTLVVSDSGPRWTGWFVASLLYNVILVSGLAMLLWFFSLKHLPAGTAGLGRLLAPVVGVLASWLQLGEIPNSYEAAGMVLILVGLAALAIHPLLRERRRTSATEQVVALAERPPAASPADRDESPVSHTLALKSAQPRGVVDGPGKTGAS